MSTKRDRYHHGDLATALLDAALGLLEEDGVDELSLRAVARRAGVSTMAPYRHYPDKEALLAAVAARGFVDLRAALLEADGASSPEEAQIALGEAYVRFACARPALFRLMFGPVRGGEHSCLTEACDAAFAVLEDRIATLVPEELRKVRALGCWTLVHGIASLILDGRLQGKVPGSTPELVRQIVAAMVGRRDPAA